LKISELAKAADVPKETIHFYLREGLLPKPRKRGKNVADYDDSYVERIRLIKSLQEQLYLPLALIKKIMRQPQSPDRQSLLEVRSDYFKPESQFLETEVTGLSDYLKATGLGAHWAEKLEQWELIKPVVKNDLKIYTGGDVIIGRLVRNMDRVGLGPKDGFDPEALKYYGDLLRRIAALASRYFFQAMWGKVPEEEMQQRAIQGREIMAVFFYHFYLKLADEEYDRLSKLLAENDGLLPDLDLGHAPNREPNE
jgi:DNA-binding transcriptional MerR regulator